MERGLAAKGHSHRSPNGENKAEHGKITQPHVKENAPSQRDRPRFPSKIEIRKSNFPPDLACHRRFRYGSGMTSLTLKNIPSALHEALRHRAAGNHRSINREAIACLEQVVLGRPVETEDLLERIRRIRARTPGRLTETLLVQARKTPRP
jgi:plasmid stability protein